MKTTSPTMTKKRKTAISRSCYVLSLAVWFAVLGMNSACTNRTPRTKVFLPAHEVRGLESSSFSLYYKSPGGATTALGQIFSPPEGHSLLSSVAFLCRGSFGTDFRPDMNVKLRISKWVEDRPASETAWESEPTVIKGAFDRGWISFAVPHIKLEPNQKYIAWISMSGLENADNASFGVVSMGPRAAGPQPKPGDQWQPNSWEVDYPEGMRAFWRQPNPDGLTDNMTKLPWIAERSGQNLHFKMVFEN